MKRISSKVVYLLLFFLGVHLISMYFGPRFIIQVHSGFYSLIRTKKVVNGDPGTYNLYFEKINFKSHDQLNLKGYFIKTPERQPKGTIILVHGIRANKEHFFKVCRLLSEKGYNSVVFDLRAHGESEGEYCTYGFHEKWDLIGLLDHLSQNKNLSHPVGVWGQSLGAAIALQAMAIDDRIKFGVIESTFSDFRQIVHDYMYLNTGFNIPLITELMIYRAENIANFSSEDVKPSFSAQKISEPVLIVHGTKDDRIKFDYARENFHALKSEIKYLEEIEGAGHLDLWEKGGDRYFKRVFEFLDDCSATKLKENI